MQILSQRGFNPRPPCGGRPLPSTPTTARGYSAFQSAPPVRGATRPLSQVPQPSEVSIRAPRAGGDRLWEATASASRIRFNPRPPCGGRPRGDRRRGPARVSIRAPRAGGDLPPADEDDIETWFQSAPPVRGATFGMGYSWGQGSLAFQSAPPVRGATSADRLNEKSAATCFNPRPPCGGRPEATEWQIQDSVFQSAPPVRGATRGQPPGILA